MEELATIYVDDGEADGGMEYAKAKRDEVIRRIVGEDNFVPFQAAYTDAYMDELKRFRVMSKESAP